MLESSPASGINWQLIGAKFKSVHLSDGGFVDFGKRTACFMARKFGLQRQFQEKLLWGDKFAGVLPEGVSTYIWRKKCFEPRTSLLLTKILSPGDTFVDIGAHFGYFSLLASRIVGALGGVISIEAMPATFEGLKKNILLNDIKNINPYNIAAYSEKSTLQFKDFGSAYSSLNTAFDVRGALEGKNVEHVTINVSADSLDNILVGRDLSKISVIKIDAEFSEEYVLKGMANLIKNYSPYILMELGGAEADVGDRMANIRVEMEMMGYNFYRLGDKGIQLVLAEKIVDYDNYLLAHQSKIDKISL